MYVSSHTLISTSKFKIFYSENGIYGFGNSRSKQLCINKVQSLSPIELAFFTKKNIKSIAVGLDHSLVLEGNPIIYKFLENGTLYGFGSNKKGELGLKDKKNYENPEEITFFEDMRIKDIFAKYGYSFVLLENRKLFAMGDNEEGQMGIGHKDFLSKPVELEFYKDKEIMDITCSYFNMIVLTKDGKIYGSGSEFEVKSKEDLIKHIKDNKVEKLKAGSDFFLILTNNGLFGYGKNDYGQLGIGNFKTQNKPVEIDFFKDMKIKDISCTNHSSLVLTSDNIIYSFGSNGYGQLGIGKGNNQNLPVKISFDFTNLYCIYSGPSHNVILMNDGIIYEFGCNRSGELGLGNKNDQFTLVKFDFFKEKEIQLLDFRTEQLDSLFLKKINDYQNKKELQTDLKEIDRIIQLWKTTAFSIPVFEKFLEMKNKREKTLIEMKTEFKLGMVPNVKEKKNYLKVFELEKRIEKIEKENEELRKENQELIKDNQNIKSEIEKIWGFLNVKEIHGVLIED